MTELTSIGYSIVKKDHKFKELLNTTRELNVSPFVKSGYGGRPKSYPVYKESETKLYLPRHYGLKNYGNTIIKDLTLGMSINVKFNGKLRPIQEKAVAAFMKTIGPDNSSFPSCEYSHGGILSLPCGFGKCHQRDTPIMMANGTIKMVQDIKVGEQIMGDDSTPRNVLSLGRGRETMYKVIPNKGDSYVVNESHILSLKCSPANCKYGKKDDIVDMTVKEYLKLPKSYHGRAGPLLGYRVPVVFPEKKVDIEPYYLGMWLGDGNSRNTGITTIEKEVIEYINNYANRLNLHVRKCDNNGTRCTVYFITSGKKQKNKLLNMLRNHKLIINKHIPHIYKCNSRKIQLEVLAGIIDSDGSLSNNGYDVIQKNEKLLDDIIFIARSLGFAAYKKKCQKSCMYKGEKKWGTYYRTNIHGPGLNEIPVKCPRKKAGPRKQIKDVLKTRIKLEKLEVDNYYGFEIDGNHRYILGDFTVTHNTILSLYLISAVGKKTIICVHKEFLMHQWHERIQQFLPGAKVGIIQQKKVDVIDKDIVIAMVQSLSLRDYDKIILDQFGMAIFDECHHLSSEVFCRCLPKISARVTLGLSATPTRADGLTKVFKWFLGDILFRTSRKKDNIDKIVRCITLDAKNAGYGEEIRVQWTGNLNSAAMLNKIAEYEPRTQLIAELAQNIIDKNSKRQILILSGRRGHLDALYDIIAKTEIPIGYYVGGMNQDSLKESEKCKIILATYNMAAEGLDIKSLNTLILATPMSNVVQAVGRILRVVNKDLPPMIIDIIDDFSSFTKQSLKRKKIYKSQGFNNVININAGSDNWCNNISKYFKNNKIKIKQPKKQNKSYLFDSDSE